MSSFCKKAFLFFSSLIVLTALNCQKKIVGPEMENFGSIELRIQLLDNLTKQNALLLTPFDSLSVTISAPDMKTMYVSKKIESGKIFVNDTILNVPAGSNRAVTICTKDKSGEIIHQDSLGVRNCRINPNEPFIINSRLIPICGSLYIQLADIPKTVDSVIVKFVAKDNTSWQTRVKRESKISVSLNKIPHLTQGTLFISGIDTAGNVVIGTSKNIAFNVNKMDLINVQFESVPGNVSINVSIRLPGVTLVHGSYKEYDTTYETGKLLITEIMYVADDSEYVEIYNPADTIVSFKKMYIEVDSTYRAFSNIEFKPRSFLVFGRDSFPWVDKVHEVRSAFNLVSNGNWLTIRDSDSTIIDRVVFSGGSNTLEWPNVSGKKSIELDTSSYDVKSNNYGRYWHVATSLIESTQTGQYGSPGRK